MSDSKHSFLQDFFQKYAHEITAFLSRRWPKEQDIADIVQESFLRLSQYPNPETIHNPRAFLFQTAANLAIDHHRRNKTREHHTETEAETESVADLRLSPYQYWEAREAIDHLNRWLEELPELQRHAFVLFRIEGFSHAEIAARLGISVRCSERYVRLAMLHISKCMDSIDS
jgi:RNA polymerase sigma factor (sigma-70 family)